MGGKNVLYQITYYNPIYSFHFPHCFSDNYAAAAKFSDEQKPGLQQKKFVVVIPLFANWDNPQENDAIVYSLKNELIQHDNTISVSGSENYDHTGDLFHVTLLKIKKEQA